MTMNSKRWSGFIAVVALLFTSACALPTFQAEPTQTAVNFKMGAPTQSRESQLLIVTMRDAEHRKLVGTGAIAARPDRQPVWYREMLRQWEQEYGMRRVADWPLSALGVRCMVFEVVDRNVAEVLRALSTEPRIETVQRVQSFRTVTTAYNDPYRQMQHSLKSMAVESAHRLATGRGVKVAVVDTGMDADHQELAGRVRVRRNMVDGNPADFKQDVHGTAVAGVIAAKAGNDSGIVGIAPEASIMAMKACWQVKSGQDSAVCNTFTLAKSLNASIAAKADVINLSLAGPHDSLLDRLIRKAIEQRIIVVGAVSPTEPNSFPASSTGVLAVGVPNDRYSRVIIDGKTILMAPGQQVISTRPGDQYDTFNGSSISAAHISGLAALAKERQPDIDGKRLSSLLRSSANAETGLTNACQVMSQLVQTKADC